MLLSADVNFIGWMRILLRCMQKFHHTLATQLRITEQATRKMGHGIQLCHINLPIYGLLFL